MSLYNPLLRTYIAVYDAGSFTKASEVLFITPAAIMNQINQLEYQLGLELFVRSKRGLIPTPAGTFIYKTSIKLIRDTEKILSQAAYESRTIRIGSSFLNPGGVLLDFIKEHNGDTEKYNFHLVPYSDDREKIIPLIASLGDRIDILVGAFNSRQMQRMAEYLVLGSYRMAVAVPLKHKLAEKSLLKISELAGMRIIMPRQEGENTFTEFVKAHPEIVFSETHYFYDLDTFNSIEDGNSLLLTLDGWQKVHPALRTIPVDWDISVPYGVLYPREHSAVLEAFLEELKSIKSL